MTKKYLFFLILSFIIPKVVFCSVSTTLHSLNVYAKPYSNGTVILKINYEYAGTNSLCIPGISPCGRSLFFNVRIYNSSGLVKEFRTGKSNCMTSTDDPSCDIPYSFNGSVIKGTTIDVIKLNKGNYNVTVDFRINIAYGFDSTIDSKYYNFTVPAVSAAAVSTAVNKTTISTVPQVDIGLRGPIEVSPSVIYEGDKVTFKIPIYLIVYSGGPYGPFLEFTIKDANGNVIAYYRVGDQGVTTSSSTNYYFNYQPTNTERDYTIVLNWTAGKAGTYYLYVKPRYSVQNWFDYDLGSEQKIFTIKVQKKVTNISYTANQTTVSTTPQVIVRIGKVTSSPKEKYPGEEITINVPVSLVVVSGGPYGPFLEFTIKDANGNVIAYYRVGDQGVTTSSSTNYYFNYQPLGVLRTYNITLNFIPTKSGAYYLYVKPRYSAQNWFDYDIGQERLIYSFTVLSGKTATGMCTDQPPISWTAWTIGNSYVTSVPIGRQVNATVMFVDPKDCTYTGEVTIQIRKNIPLSPDSVIVTKTIPIELRPNSSLKITVPFTPSDAGTYHFDVYYKSPSINYKYTAKDIARIYGTPGTDYAGPNLNVLNKQVATISVVDYYFSQNGVKTTSLVEGIKADACVVLTSTQQVTSDIKLEVYGYNIVSYESSSGPFANLKAEETKTVDISPNKNTTVCVSFIPEQSSMLHKEYYYIKVYSDGNLLGTFPADKKGAVIVTKKELETTKIVVINAAWYDSMGNMITKGTWTSGTFTVKVKLGNDGTTPIKTVISILVKSKGGLFGLFTADVHKCSEEVTIPVNGTKEVDCKADLGDGKYYFEVYSDDVKIYTGPTITIGITPYIQDLIYKIIATVGIGGIIIIILLIFFGPEIFMYTYMMFDMMMAIWERLRRR